MFIHLCPFLSFPFPLFVILIHSEMLLKSWSCLPAWNNHSPVCEIFFSIVESAAALAVSWCVCPPRLSYLLCVLIFHNLLLATCSMPDCHDNGSNNLHPINCHKSPAISFRSFILISASLFLHWGLHNLVSLNKKIKIYRHKILLLFFYNSNSYLSLQILLLLAITITLFFGKDYLTWWSLINTKLAALCSTTKTSLTIKSFHMSTTQLITYHSHAKDCSDHVWQSYQVVSAICK